MSMAKARAPRLSAPDRFPVCLPFTLAQEDVDPGNWSDPKNFSDTPGDPGGPTMNGITQAEFSAWLAAHGLPNMDVRSITQPEGYAIYRSSYWLPFCPALPPGVDLQFFDSAVNQGVDGATRILQAALGVAEDGVYGPVTEAAVRGVTDLPALVGAFTRRREIVYRATAGYPEFGADWERRAQEIGAQALKMAAP